jgi:hypothetical protein
MDGAALHTDAAAVNDADLSVSFLYSLKKIFLDQIRDLSGLERVQIDAILNGQFHRFRHSRLQHDRKRPLI